MAIVNVFCGACGATYQQKPDAPYCCGVCGSRFIATETKPESAPVQFDGTEDYNLYSRG